jgi:deazaflavin-dependent oxidoreductase (nitroreductase family)
MSTREYVPSPTEFVRDQVELYESSGGTQGNTQRGKLVVILHTIGRKTGKLRKTPLIRVEHDGSYAVVASLGGAPTDPVWYLNLREQDQAQLQDGPEPRTYAVREVTGAEREQWWERANEVWPDYTDYTTKTDRVFPIVVLEPTG